MIIANAFFGFLAKLELENTKLNNFFLMCNDAIYLFVLILIKPKKTTFINFVKYLTRIITFTKQYKFQKMIVMLFKIQPSTPTILFPIGFFSNDCRLSMNVIKPTLTTTIFWKLPHNKMQVEPPFF